MKIFTILSASISVFLATACGSSSDTLPITADSIAEYSLVLVDSFGVENGDSVNMIGSITSMCYHPNGSLLLLDNAAGCLRIIPENGEPFRALRIGSGPGEFQGAQGVCALGDGRILITDYMKLNLMTYDEHANYLGEYFPSSESDPPPELWAVDSSSIIGVDGDNLMLDGELVTYYYCARYDSSIEPTVYYYLLNIDEIEHNELIRMLDVIEFHADRNGQVYIIEDFTEYIIKIFNPDGSLAYEIAAQVDRLEKSEEQILTEIEEYESFAVIDRGYAGGYQPSQYKRLVSIAGVDEDGYLWVERFDFDTGYHFDIWDDKGQLAYRAVLPEMVRHLEISFLVDEIGMVAAVTDPDDFPRIYFLKKDNIQ